MNAGASELVHPVVITCLGDSVTHSYPYGTGDPYADSAKTYAGQLLLLLDTGYPAKNIEMHNRGVNGATADSVIVQLDEEGLPEDPDFVLLMIGGNDLNAAYDLSSFGVIVDQTVDEVQQCVDLINAHVNHDGKTPTIILSAFIPNRIAEVGGWNPNLGIQVYNGDLFNLLYPDLGEIQGEDLYFKTNFNDLYDSGEGKARAEMMFDAAHPNQAGYGIMAENWSDALVTFPLMKDTDGDGLWDQEETETWGTLPGEADSDGDFYSDLIEVSCANAAAAVGQAAHPAEVRVNFQPPKLVAPTGYAPDGGLGWN